jgi:RNA polymerase sigma-70 factor (ECF subfamily)
MTTHPRELDESDLVRQALHDVEAFAELYRRHLTRVYRYHMAHVGNARDAEDLTSQTFMAALEGIRSFRGTGSFAAWLFEPPTDKAAYHRLQLEAVSRALRQISADRAEALILTYFGGLSHVETGRVLNKSEAAVKMLISRGLQDLRERTSLALEVEL